MTRLDVSFSGGPEIDLTVVCLSCGEVLSIGITARDHARDGCVLAMGRHDPERMMG